MKLRLFFLYLLAAGVIFGVLTSNASAATVLNFNGIQSIDGTVQYRIPVPPSLAEGSEESSKVGLFYEGMFNVGSTAHNGGTFGGGLVSSYILHFDPAGDPSSNVTPGYGQVVFNDNIVAVISGDSTLNAFESANGLTSPPYNGTTQWRGAGAVNGESNDIFGVTGPNTFQISNLFVNGGKVDQIRILTSVPEVSSLLMLGLGGALIAFVSRKKRQTTSA